MRRHAPPCLPPLPRHQWRRGRARRACGGRAIQNIDFRRSSDGTATGRLIVKLTDPRTPINLRQQGNQILVDFVGADLPKNLQRSYDVADFATPVSGFDALRTPTGTQLVLDGRRRFRAAGLPER